MTCLPHSTVPLTDLPQLKQQLFLFVSDMNSGIYLISNLFAIVCRNDKDNFKAVIYVESFPLEKRFYLFVFCSEKNRSYVRELTSDEMFR